MRMYNVENKEELADALLQVIEQDSGQKVFTLRIIGEFEDALDSLIIFEDKSVLMGKISVETIGGNPAFRIRGNFI